MHSHAMDQIHQAIITGDIPLVITLCEALEFDLALAHLSPPAATPSTLRQEQLAVANILQLSHLIENELPAARAAAKRAKMILQQNSRNDSSSGNSDIRNGLGGSVEEKEFERVVEIAKCLWTRDIRTAYSFLRLDNAAPWSDLLRPLITCLRSSVQERTASLLAAAYETVSVADAKALLDLDNVTQYLCETRGWILLDDGAWVQPPPDEDGKKRMDVNSTTGAVGPGLGELRNLARMVVHLESI